ncbi:MAG TPA: sialidase family protein [Ktedonobacteraceae bacterium]|nr:sialidase family protein [Ktedonobacteraceae bacterium]
MSQLFRHPRLTSIALIVTPSLLLLLVFAAVHTLPFLHQQQLTYALPPPLPNDLRPPFQLSSDLYSNKTSQHQTEVEPGTFSYGSTIVTAFQVGRFSDGGSSNIGWATSTDGGNTWKNGFLPGTTQFAGGPFTRVSDPSVAYDAAYKTWIISSLAVTGSGASLASPAVIVNLSTDGGLSWSKPIDVVNGGSTYYDKDWITCDSTATSKFYGHCYIEWDDDNKGGLIEMSTSTNGGRSWETPITTDNKAHGLGGQPLVQPNGTVIVPISGYDTSRILSFISTDGGASWSKTSVVAKITGSVLPTAAMDGSGKVYLVWVDCQFEANCKPGGASDESADRSENDNSDTSLSGSEDDLVMSTSTDGIHWSPVQLIPIDSRGSGIDHLVPGLGVDKNTSGNNAHLALAFYYHSTTCDTGNCQFYAGFVSSDDGGNHWTKKIQLARPMNLSWLPQGRNKVGDYISTSFVDGNAFPVFSIAFAPSNGHLSEAMYTITGGLEV